MYSRFIALAITLSCFTLLGCEAMQKTARDVGNPVGQVVRVPQSITEGAAEGFVGDRDPNPYGR